MDKPEFVQLVADMRRAQKQYFRSRSTGDMETSKAMEKRVDLAVVEAIRQPDLFDQMPKEVADV